MITRLRDRVRLLKSLWRDPRTPWSAKVVLGLTLAYALSPVDLIPDFIPVLGYVDDLIIVPFGLWLAYVLVPRELWREHQREVEPRSDESTGAQTGTPGSK